MHAFRPSCLLAALLLLVSSCAAPPAASRSTAPASLRVMSFNIRYGTAQDGEFSWPARRSLVADLIRREQPAVLAIQEGLAFQLQDLAEVLADYRKYGQHREGGSAGEFSGLYVRADGFEVVDHGELWLSPTPAVIASKGWDAALPRMAVWVDLAWPDGTTLRVYGTHFDHRGQEARLHSAELLLAHAQASPTCVFLGDFNAELASPPLQAFLAAGYRSALEVLDPDNDYGTFNGFQDPQGGRRIDHVLFSPSWQPLSAHILRDQVDGIWPSDHFPVVVDLRGSATLPAPR